QRHDVEVAVDADGRILALRDRFLHDAGAYTPYGIVVPIITSTQLPGPYKLRNYAVEFDVVYTNTAMVTPYRGAGRPHGAFVMERVIGLIARELSLEPAEVRRRNFIQPHEFPWDVGLTFQDGGPTRYDSGNYPLGLELALERIDAADFRRRQAEARRERRYLGLGIGCYVEGPGQGAPDRGRAPRGLARRPGAHGRRRARPGSARHGAGARRAGDGRKSDSVRLRQGGLGGGAAARQAAGGRRPRARRGARPRGLRVLRAAPGDVRERLSRGDRGGRHRDRRREDPQVRGPA